MYGLDELCLPVHLCMPFVTVVCLASLLGPAGVNVLVALLVRIVVPKSIAFAFLNDGILPAGVALPGSLHECGINYLPLIEAKSLGVQYLAEIIKQSFEHASTRQSVLARPNSLFVRNLTYSMDAKELPKTGAVDYLVLYLVVAQTIITLQKYDFEHENNIYRACARQRTCTPL